MSTNLSSCNDTSHPSITDFQCEISRILGWTILSVAFLSILFNFRFLYWAIRHRRNRSRQNLFIFSMIFSSFLVICVMTPSIYLQSVSCRHFCSRFYCRLEGFVSYLNGVVHMFMLMMISIIRYVTVLRQSATKRYVRRNSNIAVMISWILGLAFALPPLFNLNEFVPEGLGFHCGLNWFDRSLRSRLYLFVTMLFVYFIPLIILCGINTYVYYRIRRLINRTVAINNQMLFSSTQTLELTIGKRTSPAYLSLSSATTHSYKLRESNSAKGVPLNLTPRSPSTRRPMDPMQIRNMMKLNRLQADRHFALATIFIVTEYLLSWTPYALVALAYLFNYQFIIDQPLLMTICAAIAKISMIVNPFIYILAIKTKQLKSILFCQPCVCGNCRMRK